MRADDEHIIRSVKLLQMTNTLHRDLDVSRDARPVLVNPDPVEGHRAVLLRVRMYLLKDVARARRRTGFIIRVGYDLVR